MDLKEGATLSAASGVKKPMNWTLPAAHLCCVSPAQDICALGFTYLSDQPIFLSEAFANSSGTISYSGL